MTIVAHFSNSCRFTFLSIKHTSAHTHTHAHGEYQQFHKVFSKSKGGLCLTFTCAVIKTAQGRYEYVKRGAREGHQSLTKRGNTSVPPKYYIWQCVYYCWVRPLGGTNISLATKCSHNMTGQIIIIIVIVKSRTHTFAYFNTLTNWIISGQVFNTFSGPFQDDRSCQIFNKYLCRQMLCACLLLDETK